jgi:hypothetical protein
MLADSTSRVTYNRGVRKVAQQSNAWLRGVRSLELTYRRLVRFCRRAHWLIAMFDVLNNETPRNPFL